MDIVTLGAALNGSAEYVNSHFKEGSNIQIVDNPDGTQTINASGEVSSEDTVARAEIADMKDGTTIDSFGDVETALASKADSDNVYSKAEVDTTLGNKADKSTTYTKTEVDTALSTKANSADVYSKSDVDTALGGKVDKEIGKGLSTNDYTTAEKTKLAGIADGAEVNVQSNWTQTTTTADDYIKNKPTLGTAAAKNATDTYNATGADVTTGKAVAAALATLPEPMIFKGSLGTGGTITTLPTASSSNKGYTYKVITAGTYASQSAKVGDTFISDGSAWVLIPSGDEPSGTVTNVAVANGGGLTVSGSPVTSSGTITVGHSNSVTAKISSSVKKFTYDAYGHVTGSSELSTAESNALASGIDSTKVEQIETNKNNISWLVDTGVKNLLDYGKIKTINTLFTWSGNTGTYNGVTIKIESNAIKISASNTSASVNIYVSLETDTWKNGNTYHLMGVPQASVDNVNLNIQSGSPNYYTYYTKISNQEVTFPNVNTRIRLSIESGATFSEVTIPLMMCSVAAYSASSTYQPYALSNAELTAKEQANENNILSIQEEQLVQNREIATLREITNCKLYGYRIDKQDTNPDTRVTYLYDAIGMTPAYMDFSGGSFNYGSWADIWFVKNNRPVALKFDGTVDYELSHTDFTKKIDGETASDVSDSTYGGNFMSEMPLVYVKRWEDTRYNYVVFSETKPNDDYLAQAHTNANGTVNPYIYLPMFKGSIDANNKLRSLMGTIPNGNTTAANEVTYVENCGNGWQLWDKAKIDLIMDLIVLITKSTNCRGKIGNGDCLTYNASDTRKDSKNNGANGKMMSGYEVGDTTRSANAQFYGTEGTDSTGYGTHHMIAFYIEDLWANRWDRCLGFNLVDNVYKVKMIPPYALDSDSTYQTLSVTPPSSTEGWLENVSSGVYGDVPTEVGASNVSGFANYFYKNASGARLSLFGGLVIGGLQVGRSWLLYCGAADGDWYLGGSPCYNAL